MPTVFGPVNGSLMDDDGTAFFRSGVNLANFVAETTFVGDLPRIWIPMRVMLVDSKLENFHVVSLHEISGSSFAWSHSLRRDGVDYAFVHSGVVSNVQTGANARNHIRIIAYGGVGLLFVNSAFVAEMDFSNVTTAGNVELAAFGEYDEATSEYKPVSVRFKDFTVRPIRFAFGPRSGAIEHEGGERIDLFQSMTSISDGVIDATFSNPYPTRDGTCCFLDQNLTLAAH